MNELTRKVIDLNSSDAGKAELSSIYKVAFQTPEAQLALEDLKLKCHMKTTTVDLDIANADLAMKTKEGMRMVFLEIESQLEYDPAYDEAMRGLTGQEEE